jgi:hypothetical protein
MLITVLVITTLVIGLPALWKMARSTAWSLMAFLPLMELWLAQYWRWNSLDWQSAYWRDVGILQSRSKQPQPETLNPVSGDNSAPFEGLSFDQVRRCSVGASFPSPPSRPDSVLLNPHRPSLDRGSNAPKQKSRSIPLLFDGADCEANPASFYSNYPKNQSRQPQPEITADLVDGNHNRTNWCLSPKLRRPPCPCEDDPQHGAITVKVAVTRPL